jgi:hypothetical protein
LKFEEQMHSHPLENALLLGKYNVKTIPLYRVVDGVCNCHKGIRCESPGKHPVWKRFYEKATSDPQELMKLYTDNVYNVGIPTGEVNGLVILDFDGEEGMRTLAQWRERGLSDTWEVTTASGGKHLIYSLPFEVEIDGIPFEVRNTVKSIGAGVDVRGEHGFTVGPGSIGLKGQYVWARDPENEECAEIDEWVLRLIYESMKKTPSRINLEEIDIVINWDVELSPELEAKINVLRSNNEKFNGSIDVNKVLYKSDSDRDWALIKEMLKGSFSPQEIADFLVFFRRLRGCKMKDDRYYARSISNAQSEVADDLVKEAQAQSFVDSMTQEEIAEELKVERPKRPTVDAFPTHVFPQTIREYIQKASSSLSVPHDFIVVNILAAASIAMGKSYEIEVKKGYTQLGAIYIMLVADPGTSKSPAMNIVFKPIFNMQVQLDSEYEQRKLKYELDCAEYARKEAEWKKLPKATRGEGPLDDKGNLLRAPALIPRESVFTTDATPEALAPLMQSNLRSMALLQDELSAHINGMDQYKGGKGADRQFYLSCWANANIRVNRKRDPEPIVVNKTYLTIVGNLPPGTLMQLDALTKHEDGYTDRYLISYPDNQEISEYNWEELSEEDEVPWINIINKLFEAEPQAYYEGEVIPHRLQMSLDAKFEWGEWHTHHHRERTAEGFPQRLQGVYSKMTNQLARITLILHRLWVASGEIEDGEISDTIVKHACKIVDYFKQNARKVYQQMEITQEESRVEEAMDWITQNGGRARLRDLYRNKVAGCKRRSDAESMFSDLEDYGYGHVVDVKPARGRSTKEFIAFN